MSSAIIIKVLALSVFHASFVLGDYKCLCNYNIELPIYATDSSADQVIGYLYEFDCKAVYGATQSGAKFTQVQFENKIGYIENGDGIQVQVCRGNVPFQDIVTTTSSKSITSTTTSPRPKTSSTEAITSGVTEETPYSSTEKINVAIVINVYQNHTIVNGNTSHSGGNSTSKPNILSPSTATTSLPMTTNISNTSFFNLTSQFQKHLNKTLVPSSSTSTTRVLTSQISVTLSSLFSTSTTTVTTSTSTTETPALKPSCPSGWTMYRSSCYLFQTKHRSQWHEANNDCVSKSSHLAIVDNVDEFTFLKQHLDRLIDTHIHDGSDSSAWVAGRDDRLEGHWEWFDGLTNTYKQFTYTHWGNDEPDAGDHEHEEDCMTMVGNKGFLWADYSCNEHMFYVCEQSTTITGNMNLATTQMPSKQMLAAGCPQGWEIYQGSCYLFHTDSRENWQNANSVCVSHQAHLAIIESAEEDHFLKQQSSQRIHVHDDDSDSGVWVAGSDDDNEGRWEWIDGYSHTNTLIQGYSNWHKGEPDSGDGDHDEDCMCMIGVKNYEWQDYRCHTHMYFICEKTAIIAAPIVG